MSIKLNVLLVLVLFSSLAVSGNPYRIDRLDLAFPGGSQFAESELTALISAQEYRLNLLDGVLVGRQEDGQLVRFRLDALPASMMDVSGLVDLQQQVAARVNRAGYLGVVVVPAPEQMDARTGQDFRVAGGSLTLNVWISQVSEVRTVGKGVRIRDGNALNNPRHAWILARSPVQVEQEEGATFLRRGALQTYVERLNELPSRRVDLAVSSAGRPGEVVLDYLVSEAKPWLVYAQVLNTGTESTGEWRQRIGGVYNQLTGNDDIITLDYITASLDRSHAVSGSYEIPLWKPNYIKARIYGSYSDFEAENLILETAPDFSGTTLVYGAELEAVPFYLWGHAVRLFAGFRRTDIEVENIFGQSTGEAVLDVPYVGFTVSRNRSYHKSFLSVRYEENSKGIDNITSLGRLETTAEFELIKLDFQQSIFLDYLFSRSLRNGSRQLVSNLLVHELSFSVSGQKTLKNDTRLIPQAQRFVGGFFSVRGYPESVVGGDSVLTTSVEYRWWITRMLRPYNLFPEEEKPTRPFGGNFNLRQPDPFSPADLDVSLRFFLDYASTTINQRRVDEANNQLMSVGAGLNLQVYRNLLLRVDYGYTLRDAVRREEDAFQEDVADRLADPKAAKGKSRIHVLLSYAF